jgi:hypothetical protein
VSLIRQLREQIMLELDRIGLGDLHAADLQNCLASLTRWSACVWVRVS